MAAGNLLEANAPTAGIGQISYGASITTSYNSLLVDSRTPEIIGSLRTWVSFTREALQSKRSTGVWPMIINVMLLVSNPGVKQNTIYQSVETKQVAPTILQLLGLDPNALDAVKLEGTTVLPCLFSTGAVSPLYQ